MRHPAPARRRALITAALAMAIAGFSNPPPAMERPSPATDAAGSAPASSRPALPERQLEQLVAQLGDADFARREQAQMQLAQQGERALSVIMRHLDDRDGEIARRAVALVTSPHDPAKRVDVSVALLQSGRSDRVEIAILMLFEAPEDTTELFRRRLPQAGARVRRMAPDILDALDSCISEQKRSRDYIANLPAGKAEIRAKFERGAADMKLGRAKQAFLFAMDSIYDEAAASQTSQGLDGGADKPPAAASQP